MQQAVNPFKHQQNPAQEQAGLMVEQERAIQEVQASMIVAKRFPRNQITAMERINQACTRPTLAESSMYAYPRGGEIVTGPSIRLAEALAQNWGNMQFGIRELSQANGESTVEAFAWDIETNTRQVKVFQVPHKRYSKKKGLVALTDPRDIYEIVANQGSRRLRACILGVIPGDVIDSAVRQCEITLENREGAPKEQIKSLVDGFAKFNITQEMIAKRLGHHLDSVIAAEIIQLRKIYVSLRDRMAKPEDFFEVTTQEEKQTSAEVESINEKLKQSVTTTKKPDTSKPDTTQEQEKKDDQETAKQPTLTELKTMLEQANNQDDIDLVEDMARSLNDYEKEALLKLTSNKRKSIE